VSAKLSGTFYRNAGGAPTNIPTDDNIVRGTGAVGSSTFELTAFDSAIQVGCTPGTGALVDWAVVVIVTEGSA
jgi:hypothetical protein